MASALSTIALALTASAAYELKYDSPAKVWEEALPLGSGSVGAMVWGGVEHETVDLNDDTVWSGSPNSHARRHATSPSLPTDSASRSPRTLRQQRGHAP